MSRHRDDARSAFRAVVMVLVAVGFMLVVAFLPSAVWATEEPTTTPEPTPTATVTETVTADPEPVPAAPGEDSGVYVDPGTGAVRFGERSAVALAVAGWLAAVTAGLATSWLVLP